MASRSKRSSETASGAGHRTLPVLAVRDAIHFPGALNTIHVVREPSLRALRNAIAEDHLVVVLGQRDMAVEDPQPDDLFQVGTLSEILQSIPLPDGSLRVALRALARVRAHRIRSRGGLFVAETADLCESPATTTEAEALARACLTAFTRIVGSNAEIPPEALQGMAEIHEGGALADAILHHLPVRTGEKQALLEELDHHLRLERTLSLLQREEELLEVDRRIRERVDRAVGASQREFYLREQLRAIKTELSEYEDLDETAEYREEIDRSGMPAYARAHAEVELRRLERTPAASPEGMVLRNYLDTLVALPWNRLTEDRLDVNAAQRLLDERHFGLERVKDRILDHLAVRQLRGSLRGPILCFLGPPGVGKTSIGRSIADAMGRRFLRISLGGVRDEAEIRGHRRTYVGSMPGRILAGLRDCGSRNPVILMDEIDKIPHGPQGDPTSALLEALDPEQNPRFSDHYVEVPFDLSAAMFIATANLLENVPSALRDRMEVIPFPSYTDVERVEIARRFLLPKATKEHGLRPDQIDVPYGSLQTLADEYSRESGVRELGRQIETLCRKAARQVASGNVERVEFDDETLRCFLGPARYRRIGTALEDVTGCAQGLVVSEVGGDLITVEVTLTEPLGERPELLLTGNLGAVMRESAQAALTAVRAYAEAVEGAAPLRKDVHVHVPEAAIPKDGPSAGVTIAVALASAFLGRPVRGDVAMTGEITLRGRILPVGGVSEKIIAAGKAGLRTILIPGDNSADLDELPDEVRTNLEVRPIRHLTEALDAALAE